MQRRNEVPKEPLLVVTEGRHRYELGQADEKGERTIILNGRPLSGHDRWGVLFLEVGSRMEFYPSGEYDPDSCRSSGNPVKTIQPIG